MKMAGERQKTERPEDGRRQAADGNREGGRRKTDDREGLIMIKSRQ